MGLLAALQFLTIIPVKRDFTAEEVGRSTGYFPVVGLIIGLVLAALNHVLGLVLPASVVNVLLVVSMVVLSGGLHLEGLIDTCDGIAGHGTPEERWRRMHDSRAGAFGVIGACLIVLVKYVSLNAVPQNLMTPALITASVLSRWAMVYALFAYPYARPEGLGKAFREATRMPQFIMATIIALVVAGFAFKLAGIAIFAIIWLVVVAVAAYLKRKIAGLTGDTYGMINEIAEAAVFIVVSLLAYRQWLV